MQRLRQLGLHVQRPVVPAVLVSCRGDHRIKRRPKPRSAIANSKQRRLHPTISQAPQHASPTPRALVATELQPLYLLRGLDRVAELLLDSGTVKWVVVDVGGWQGLRAQGLESTLCRHPLAAPDRGIVTQSQCIIVAASDITIPASLSCPVPSLGFSTLSPRSSSLSLTAGSTCVFTKYQLFL